MAGISSADLCFVGEPPAWYIVSMMVRHDARCHTPHGRGTGKACEWSGVMVFRCNESNETLTAHPDSNAAAAAAVKIWD